MYQLCSLHPDLFFLQPYPSFLQSSLLCLQPDLYCLQSSLLCLQPALYCLQSSLLCLQPKLCRLYPDLPYTTQLYHKRKQQEEEQTGQRKRLYMRKTSTISCMQCRMVRDPANHQQYFGNWYCQATATVSLAEWRAALEARGYGKKKDGK
ncbi:uncharacterized protein V6R79_015155 [Siganus canaliculatus]